MTCAALLRDALALQAKAPRDEGCGASSISNRHPETLTRDSV
jgi:hypothetical protein